MKDFIRRTLVLTKKELVSMLDNAATYVVVTIFLIAWYYLFFRNVFVIGESSLSLLFNLFPWLSLFLIPALTMGSVSKEKDAGTLELILTHPIKSYELIFSKFLSVLVFVFVTVLFTVPTAIYFNKYGPLDWGIYAGQLIGTILFSAALIALGVFISSVFSSQIASLLVSVFSGFLFVVFGTELVTISLPTEIGNYLEKLSLANHYQSLTRGVISLSDVFFFGLFTFVFLLLANFQIIKQKSNDLLRKNTLVQWGVLLVAATVILTDVPSYFDVRYDITQNKIYTLSKATLEVIQNINEPLNITLYASENLPAQYAPILRETRYILQDYNNAGKDKILLEFKDPTESEETEQQVLAYGIQRAQFNIVGQDELQAKTGYLGILLSYKNRNEVVSFVQGTADLEYEITSLINKLVNNDKKTIGFLNGHNEKSIYEDYGYLSVELSKLFNLKPVYLSEEIKEIDPSIDVLVIAGPTTELDENTLTAINNFRASGGSVVFLIDNLIVNNNFTSGPAAHNLQNYFEDEGINLRSDLVYDLRFYELLNIQEGTNNFALPYPFWVRASVSPISQVDKVTQKTISLPWPSSITFDGAKANEHGYTIKPLLVTSDYAGVKRDDFVVIPDQELSNENLGKVTVGVTLEPTNPEQNKGKLVVISDSEFLVDMFLERVPTNLAFGIDLFSWVASERSLADIQVKVNAANRFAFTEAGQPSQIRFSVLAIAVFVPVLVGVTRYTRRRLLRSKSYSYNK